jgi:perosamine synthetase
MFRSIPPCGTRIKLKEIFSSFFSSLGCRAVKKFEEELCKYFQVEDCFLVSSGRAGLTMILRALKKITDKDEVIIPAYTCFSVPSAIAKAGLKVRLCDVSLETLNLNPDKFPHLLNKNTLAVIPVYHFGLAHDISGIINLCREEKVFVIEDVAQAMGAKMGDKFVGTFGDVSFFSLGRGKNITTIEGGIIFCQNPELSSLLREEFSNLDGSSGIEFFLKSLIYKIFLSPSFFWIPEKMPFLGLGQSKFSLEYELLSLSEYQSRLGAYLMTRLEEINSVRVKNAQYLISHLRALDKISILPTPVRACPVYLRLPILFKESIERERKFQSLRRKKLGVSKMYPTTLEKIHDIKNHLVEDSVDLVNSHLLEKVLLTLPTHEGVREKDLELICQELSR